VRLRSEAIASAACMVLAVAWEGERNGNYRHGARTKETMETVRLIKKLARGSANKESDLC
jgi:hypothetical protein